MGPDDLGRWQFFVAALAATLTVAVSGPATLLSYGCRQWALSSLARGFAVQVPRYACGFVLVWTGIPVVYATGLLLSFPGPLGAAGLLAVVLVSVSATLHAAFRHQS